MPKTRYIILATLILIGFWVAGQVQVNRFKSHCEVIGTSNNKWYECDYKEGK